jgi:hypothetical protein
MDSGVENVTDNVDRLFAGSALHRVIAQIDVSFSNSLIEAWWRSLKHQWLFLHPLDNIVTVKKRRHAQAESAWRATAPQLARHVLAPHPCPTTALPHEVP